MFKKLFKKESTLTNEVKSRETDTISTDKNTPITDEQHDETVEELPEDLSELSADEDYVVNDVIEPINDEDFNAEFDVPDVGVVNDIDEEILRSDLESAIAKELMAEENLLAVEERADMIETEMGITQQEWDDKYNNIELLGYENREQQAMVFGNVLPKEFDAFTDSVLDVGCGVGDLYAYIQEVLQCQDPEYTGIDMDSNMIDIGKEKFPEIPTALSVENILEIESNKKWDWVVAMSAFNVKVDGVEDMTEYVKQIINKMYSLSEKGIAINLMHSYPKGEDWSDTMTTFDSNEITTWAMKHYYNIKTHRNYIDRDFILYIYK